MEFFEIKVEILVFVVDEMDNVLFELGVEGWSLLEDVIVKWVWIVGIFESVEEVDMCWEELWLMLLVELLSELECWVLGDCDWCDSYKVYFKVW